MKNEIIYTHILIESLRKKREALESVLKHTKAQEKVLAEENFDEELFEILIEKKQECIELINSLDEGFELTFEHVKEELKEKKEVFRNEILSLQQLIRQITDVSTQIQVLESRNRLAFDNKMKRKKENIRMARMSSKTVNEYYKNVANAHTGESIFLDKKK